MCFVFVLLGIIYFIYVFVPHWFHLIVIEITSIVKINHVIKIVRLFHWRIQGGAPGTRAPPGGPNSFIFMQFSAKNWKIIAFLGVGAPPGENPGSATVFRIVEIQHNPFSLSFVYLLTYLFLLMLFLQTFKKVKEELFNWNQQQNIKITETNH